MKKKLLLFMLLPAISLTANTNNLYNPTYNIQNQKKIIRYAPRKIYRQNNTRVQSPYKIMNKHITRQVVPSRFNRTGKARNSTVNLKSFAHILNAAKSGHPKAQFDLAIMYATGRGVQKNEKIAFNWFHKSARNNYAPAKHYMGISFLQGRGVRKQKELARYWFRLASKQGYRPSMAYLSQINMNRV